MSDDIYITFDDHEGRIGGKKTGWRAGGDRGKMEFHMSDEQWERIFGTSTPVCDVDCGGHCDVFGGCPLDEVSDES